MGWSGNLTVRDSVKISASQTSSGTTPAGSTWRRHPIPSLEFCGVGPCDVSKCPAGWTQSPCPAFKPPCDGCWGGVVDSQGGAGNSHHEDFEVLDDVVIPTDWPAGDYTLQWRWDTESLPGYKQVWTNLLMLLSKPHGEVRLSCEQLQVIQVRSCAGAFQRRVFKNKLANIDV